MPMKGWVKFHSPQKISAASQQNSVASINETTELDGDLFWNVNWKTSEKKNMKLVHTARPA